jgi:class 3 adenylate cyclase
MLTRKTVTVLFCDVTGSTELGETQDPEVLRTLLARYFDRMKAIVESHGGTVEKFIGDAVMAVFGIPAAHEDDALRACRSAVQMRDALPELGIRGRIGVNTGEVVSGTEERLATGDAVNVAARLEQAAEPGEVLLGAATYALAQEAVTAEPVDALDLKGKSEPVAAFRLLAVLDAPERRHDSRFVGRGAELTAIAAAWTRALGGCELVTVVGDAGVGKSRLVAEALAAIDARVVRGRCLPYGDAITYWPVVEVARQLETLPSDPVASAAIRSLLGESDVGTSGEEIAWAFRKLLEEQAPLVVVFDDLQWGDDTFLDLVESVALLSAGAPLLLLCMARPELVERRPGWPGLVRLEPLAAADADALIGESVPEDLRERIAHAAGGNPLFISEMLAMAAGNAEVVDVPPTLKALLAARLDQLDQAERRVLEHGAVEGEIFHRGAVQALTPDEAQVTTRLTALVRHQLVRPDRAQLAGDDGYRFRHLLIRDAAYDALPKTVRAELHARFADWLEEHGAALVELDEIVGYHLGQASRYYAELGEPDAELADRASARLAAAGNRARDRQDYPTATVFLGRAAELMRPHRTDVTLELEFLWSADWDAALPVELAEVAVERVRAAGDRSGTMLARAMVLNLRAILGDAGAMDGVIALCRTALPLEEERGDPRRLALLWEILAGAANHLMQNDESVDAELQARRYQRLAGYARSETFLEYGLILGPRPAGEALRTIDELADSRPPGAQDLPRAALLAMLGHLEEAWPLAEARSAHLREVSGSASWDAHVYLSLIATIEGDRERACRYGAETLDAVSEATVAAAATRSRMARELCYLGRFDEAERLLDEARAVPPTGSGVRVMAAASEALLLAHRGELEQAEELARTAVATAEANTDNVWWHAYTNEDLGFVLECAGRIDEARAALERALGVWERKQCLPCAARVREQLKSF